MSLSDSLPDPDSQPISASLPQPGDESVSSNPGIMDKLSTMVGNMEFGKNPSLNESNTPPKPNGGTFMEDSLGSNCINRSSKLF